MKKNLKLVWVVCLMVMMAAVSLVVNGETYGDFEYTFSNGEVSIFACYSTETAITIPETIDGCPVTSIGQWAFRNCKNLKSITIGNSIKSIGHYAFYECGALESVTICDSVTDVGKSAFYNCAGLKTLVIGNGVESIGEYAFSGCTCLESVTLGNGIKSVGSNAFYKCTELKFLYISDVENWCSISFASGISNPIYYAESVFVNNKILKELIIPDSVVDIQSYAFSKCSSIESLTIPDSVTSICASAFSECENLKKVSFGKGMESLGSSAFSGCYSLEEVHISDVGAWCNISFDSLFCNPLYYAEKLYINGISATHVIIPDNVTDIGNYAFGYCKSIVELTVGNGVTSIGVEAFYKCENLVSVNGCKSIKNIDEKAFYMCDSLEKIMLGNCTESIGDSVFSSNAFTVYYSGTSEEWKSIFIGMDNSHLLNATKYFLGDEAAYTGTCGENLTWEYYDYGLLIINGTGNMSTWSASANVPWYGYSIKEVVIADGVTSIGAHAFSSTDINKILLPEGITSIGDYALQASNLSSVFIPAAVTEIGRLAFSHSFDVDSNNKYYSSDKNGVLFNKDKTVLIQYPINNYLSVYKVPDSVEELSEHSFRSCRTKAVIIPDSVKVIGDTAFQDAHVERVFLGNGITSIGFATFYRCSQLRSITIPDFVISIEQQAFQECYSLESIIVGKGLSRVGLGAFMDCNSLTTVYCPGKTFEITVEEFGNSSLLDADYVFDYELTWADKNILFSGSCGDNAHWNMDVNGKLSVSGTGKMYNYSHNETPWEDYVIGFLDSIVINHGITGIGSRAFFNCNFNKIHIPCSVVSVGTSAFSFAYFKDACYYHGTKAQWDKIAVSSDNDELIDANIEFMYDTQLEISPIKLFNLKGYEIYEIPEETFNVSVMLTNNSCLSMSQCMVCVYNEKGVLTSIDLVDVTADIEKFQIITSPVNNSAGNVSEIKVFVLGVDNMFSPLVNVESWVA